MREINENKVEVLGRLIPNSGKIHQNQEVYNALGERSMCTIKATHYKDPPKILVDCEMEKEDEQDYSTGQFEKRQ